MKFNGQLFWIYVMLYGIVRPINEMFRADFRGEMIYQMFSISQVIGWSMVILGIVMLFILSGRAKSESQKNA